MTRSSENRCFRRFQETRDPRLLGKVLDATAAELLRVAGWLVGNRSDAEDLLKRTFVTVIEARGNYDPSKRAMPWLVGILGNHAKKLKEQKRRQPDTLVISGEASPLVAAADAEFARVVAELRVEL